MARRGYEALLYWRSMAACLNTFSSLYRATRKRPRLPPAFFDYSQTSFPRCLFRSLPECRIPSLAAYSSFRGLRAPSPLLNVVKSRGVGWTTARCCPRRMHPRSFSKQSFPVTRRGTGQPCSKRMPQDCGSGQFLVCIVFKEYPSYAHKKNQQAHP